MSSEEAEKEKVRKNVEYANLLLQLFFESVDDVVMIQDLEYRIIKANKAAYRLARLYNRMKKSEDIVGKKCHHVFHGSDEVCATCPITTAIERKSQSTVEHYDVVNSRWYDYLVYPIFDQGKIVAVAHLARDITEKKKLQESIEKEKKRSEDKFKSLIERSTDSMAIVQDGRIAYCNQKTSEIFGYPREELINKPFVDFLNKEQQKIAMQRYEARMAGEELASLYELKVKRNDGTELEVEVNAGLIEWNGRSASLSMIRDITERRRLEEERRSSEAKYRDLIERSNDSIAILQEGLIVFTNQNALTAFGYTAEELREHPFTYFSANEEEARKLMQRYKDRMAGKELSPLYESQLRRKNGDIIDVEISGGVAEWDNKPADMAVVRDVTERKRLDRKIRASEQQYRSTIDSLGDALHVIDKDSRLILVNQALNQWLKRLKLKEVQIGQSIKEIFPFLPLKIFKEYEYVFDSGQPLITIEEIEIDEQKYYTETRKIPIFVEGHVVQVITIIRELTKERMAEEKVRESEEKFRTMTDQSLMGICIVQDRRIKYANETVSKILGYSIDEMLQWQTKELYKLILPAEKALGGAAEERLLSGEMDKLRLLNFKVVTKSGETKWVDLHNTIIQYQGMNAYMVTFVEVSDRQLAEEKVKESEEKFRRIFEITPDLFYLVDKETTIMGFEGEPEQLPIPPEQFLGKKITDVIPDAYGVPKEIVREAPDIVKRVLETKVPHIEEYSLPFKGEEHFHEARFFYFTEERVGVFTRDITDRKKAEEELKKMHQLNELILDTVEVSINTADLDGKVITFNKGSEQIFGWTAEEVIGKHVKTFHPEEDHDTILPQLFDDALNKGKFERILNLIRKNGEKFVASLTVVPLHDRNNEPIGLVGIARDLSPKISDIK